MENPTIGIKIADGSYIPILEKDDPKKKKVVLTTVRDEQTKVQIDLFRGEGKEMSNAQYIGTLLIDNIAPATGGEPEIELQLGMDPEGNLMSLARDLKGTEEQSLALNLEDLPESGAFEVPDFEFKSDVEAEGGPAGEAPAASAEAAADSDLDFDLDMNLDLEEPAKTEPTEPVVEESFEAPQAEAPAPVEDSFELPAEEPAPAEQFSFDQDLTAETEQAPAQAAEPAEESFEAGGLGENMPESEPEDSYSTPKHLANGYDSAPVQAEERRSFPILPVAIGAAALLLIVGLAFFLFMPKGGQPSTPPVTQEKPAAPAPQPIQPAPTPPVTAAPQPAPSASIPPAAPAPKIAQPAPQKPAVPAPQKPAAPAPKKPAPQKPAAKAQPAVKAGEPVGDVYYYTVKGDNLWNLAKSFYRNPWLFKKIAKENGLSNPDLIRQGQRIIIPEAQGKKR